MDVTILYYTASIFNPVATSLVREDLLNKKGDIRIVSVSQKPLDFGDNICVGEIGQNVYNLYKQVLIGAKEVKTKFILCAEDDFLYPKERFNFASPTRDDTFYYDTNRWTFEGSGRFWWRDRRSFGTCIAPTQALIETLENRFKKVTDPDDTKVGYFSEPGKYESSLHIPMVKLETFHSEVPIVTFNHRDSLGKSRKKNQYDVIVTNLPPWGDGKELWKKYFEVKREVEFA